jgi:hypothetical protein
MGLNEQIMQLKKIQDENNVEDVDVYEDRHYNLIVLEAIQTVRRLQDTSRSQRLQEELIGVAFLLEDIADRYRIEVSKDD